jgi:hypothetical protein
MIGTAIKTWLNASGVGVRIAAEIKEKRTAYFLFFARLPGETIPNFVRKIITSGSSKIAPNARINFRQKSI